MLSVRKTRNWRLCSIAGLAIALSSCAVQTENPWDSIEVPVEVVETPLPCAELPEPQGFDEIGKGRIQAMRECAAANFDIATEHVTQIEQLRESVENLVEAGQSQRVVAEMNREMLEDERRGWLFERIGYVLLVIGSFAL